MDSNGIGARLMAGLVLWLAALMHSGACTNVANTPAGMLIYHGSAALVDYGLLIYSAYALSGNLSYDMQMLNFVSMIFNFIGWILYLAYSPPVIYNTLIAGLGYAQLIRLLIVGGRYDHIMGDYLVRSNSYAGAKFYSKKAH